MRFELSGKLVVEADNIRDAFRVIAEHFTLLANGEESTIPKIGTDIKLKRSGSKTPILPPPLPKRASRPPKKS